MYCRTYNKNKKIKILFTTNYDKIYYIRFKAIYRLSNSL